MRTSASSSSSSRAAVIGSLPTNSGISPYFTKSSGSSCFKSSIRFIFLAFLVISPSTAPKPRVFLPTRLLMISSIPSKAPPHIKRIFVVSTCIYSCCGCFLPPCGGTFATVPSIIFKSAC